MTRAQTKQKPSKLGTTPLAFKRTSRPLTLSHNRVVPVLIQNEIRYPSRQFACIIVPVSVSMAQLIFHTNTLITQKNHVDRNMAEKIHFWTLIRVSKSQITAYMITLQNRI